MAGGPCDPRRVVERVGGPRTGVRRRAGRSPLTETPAPSRQSARLFWGTALTIIAIDLVTKLLAERYLAPRHVPHQIIGDVVRFTLAYNPGAAFSMSLGPYSRYIFGTFAVIALVVLWRLYRMSGAAQRAGDRLRILALGLAWGGAAGNLVDRFRSPQGVVDFIDIGVQSWRFWTFNVADSAVTVGAVALAWSLSKEEREEREAARAAVIPDDPPPADSRAATDGRDARGAAGPET